MKRRISKIAPITVFAWKIFLGRKHYDSDGDLSNLWHICDFVNVIVIDVEIVSVILNDDIFAFHDRVKGSEMVVHCEIALTEHPQ